MTELERCCVGQGRPEFSWSTKYDLQPHIHSPAAHFSRPLTLLMASSWPRLGLSGNVLGVADTHGSCIRMRVCLWLCDDLSFFERCTNCKARSGWARGRDTVVGRVQVHESVVRDEKGQETRNHVRDAPRSWSSRRDSHTEEGLDAPISSAAAAAFALFVRCSQLGPDRTVTDSSPLRSSGS
jgi:hypothetical protein